MIAPMTKRKWCEKCGSAVAWRQGRSGKWYLAHVKVASSRTPEIILRTPHSTLCSAVKAEEQSQTDEFVASWSAGGGYPVG